MRYETRETLWALALTVGGIVLCFIVAWLMWPSEAHAATCTPLPTCGDPGVTVPCATPTPVLAWDPAGNVAGYTIYWRATGVTTWTKLVDLPAWLDDWSVTRQWGVDAWVPLQRVCPACAEFQSYDFAVKAYDAQGNRSANYSNVVTACMSHVWVKPERYQ